MVSVLWRAQPPEYIHFTHKFRKYMEIEEMILRGTLSLVIISTFETTVFKLYLIFLLFHCAWTSTKQRRKPADEVQVMACVQQTCDRKRPQQLECSVVLCVDDGLGEMEGHRKEHYRREVLGYRGNSHILFLFPLNRGKDG